jgi:hypothetical protein
MVNSVKFRLKITDLWKMEKPYLQPSFAIFVYIRPGNGLGQQRPFVINLCVLVMDTIDRFPFV